MVTWHDLLYFISLLIGAALAIGSALGLADFDGHIGSIETGLELDAAGAPFADDGVLQFLGVGRVPLTVLGLACCLIFGGSGLALGPICRALFGASVGPWLGLALASGTALAGTAGVARLFTRYLPLSKSYAGRKQQLLGLGGRVIACDARGEAIVAVLDDGGAEMRVRALIEGGKSSAGTRVALSGYDPAHDLFLALEVLEHELPDFLPSATTNSKERGRA